MINLNKRHIYRALGFGLGNPTVRLDDCLKTARMLRKAGWNQ